MRLREALENHIVQLGNQDRHSNNEWIIRQRERNDFPVAWIRRASFKKEKYSWVWNAAGKASWK